MRQLLGSSPCGRTSATLTQGSNGLASTPGGHELEFLLSSAERMRVCTRLPVSLARKGHGLLVAWRLLQGELPARNASCDQQRASPVRCVLHRYGRLHRDCGVRWPWLAQGVVHERQRKRDGESEAVAPRRGLRCCTALAFNASASSRVSSAKPFAQFTLRGTLRVHAVRPQHGLGAA